MKVSNNNSNAPLINVIVALDCEARVFIDHYRLQRQHAVSAFKVYVNSEQTIYLVVSGVGKINMATATGFIFEYTGAKPWTCLCNIGVAGGQFPLGSCYLIHKVIDAATKQAYYPALLPQLKLDTMQLTTFDQAQTNYCADYLMDMEASGFMQAARHFVTVEQMQLLKIISDNAQGEAPVTASGVIDLIKNNTQSIDAVIKALLAISLDEAKNYTVSPGYQELLNQYHFSHYQQHELRELLRCWAVSLADKDPVACCQQLHSSKEVLLKLKQALAVEKVI